MPQGSSGPNKAMRERLKLAILEDAHIVCSTLAFSGSPLLSRLSRPFDVVVIDEAAQAVEPSTLIPLCTGAQQVCQPCTCRLSCCSCGADAFTSFTRTSCVANVSTRFTCISRVAKVSENQLPRLQVHSNQDHL